MNSKKYFASFLVKHLNGITMLFMYGKAWSRYLTWSLNSMMSTRLEDSPKYKDVIEVPSGHIAATTGISLSNF